MSGRVVNLDEPSVTAWTLRGGRYTDEMRAVGAEPFEVRRPFAVGFAPADLV